MRREKPRSRCPLNLSLEVFGDRWTLLVLRDIVFAHKRHFREFLASTERIATNILADRLRTLEAEGIISRRPDPSSSRQVIYLLEDKGKALLPTLIELILWGGTYGDSAAPDEFIRRAKEDREALIAEVLACIEETDERVLRGEG